MASPMPPAGDVAALANWLDDQPMPDVGRSSHAEWSPKAPTNAAALVRALVEAVGAMRAALEMIADPNACPNADAECHAWAVGIAQAALDNAMQAEAPHA